MRTRLIQIGNSKGVRLPQTFIRQYQLQEEIIIEPTGKGLLISSATAARHGWEEQFKNASQGGKEKKDNWNHLSNRFDKEDWTW